MMTSIRWRLVAGFTLITLLTAVAIGILAMSLVRRYVERQETAYLQSNAEAIASQSAYFLYPMAVRPALQQLAQMAAFLGNMQVRILDADQQVVAQSNLGTVDDVAWMVQSETVEMQTMAAPVMLLQVAPAQVAAPAAIKVRPPEGEDTSAFAAARVVAEEGGAVGKLATKTQVNVIMVQKASGVWGDQLRFAPGVLAETEQFAPADEALGPEQFTLQLSPFITSTHITGTQIVENRLARSYVITRTVGGDFFAWSPAVPGAHVWAMPVLGMDTAGADGIGIDAAQAKVPSQESGAPARSVMTPIYHAEQVVGYVELSRPMPFGEEPLAAIRQALWIAAGVASLLAIGLALAASQGLTAPLQSLAAAAAGMSRNDLSVRAPVRGCDEISALARQFNEMADRLQSAFADLAAERDALRRFIADASHELRTPITALRTFNELLQGGLAENGLHREPEVQREFLHESEEQISRLEWITRNLLDLSRLDAGLAALALAEHDARDLLAAAAAPFRTLAAEKEIALKVELPPAVTLVCDGARMERALCNLLDNALKFTAAGRVVHAGVIARAESVCFWVEDTGIGIEEKELPHIFDRFHRCASAQQPGSGLGLAIVQSVVLAHGGRVEVNSKVGEGSRFEIWLPSRQS